MGKRMWAMPCVGLLAVGGVGCAGMSGARSEAPNPTAQRVQASQDQSQKALQAANDAQKRANDQQRRAAQAQADVQRLQQQLTAAQQKAEQEQAKAQQLQQQASETARTSAQEAQQAQQQASRTLEEQGQQVRRGEQTIAGQVTQATPDELAIRSPQGTSMTFRITNDTQVVIDGRRGSAADIQRGEDARVAYSLSGTQPMATHVQVMTGNPMGQPPSGAGTGSSSSSRGDTSTGSGSTTSGSGTSPSGSAPPAPPADDRPRSGY